MLLGGIGCLLVTTPFLLFGLFVQDGMTFGLGSAILIRGIGLIVVSFGIRNMRRWALYTLTALTVLALFIVTYHFTTEPANALINFVDVGIQTTLVIYLWTIVKRFT